MENFIQAVKHTIKYWYVPLIIGIVHVAVGIIMLMTPLQTYATLSVLFGVSFLVSGLFEMYFSIENRKLLDNWGWYLAGGIFAFVMGIFLTIYPVISLAVLPFYVGFALLFRSFQTLVLSFELEEFDIPGWGYVALLGTVGIIISTLMLLYPLYAAMSLVVMTALAFLVAGTAFIAISLKLKKIKDFPKKVKAATVA